MPLVVLVRNGSYKFHCGLTDDPNPETFAQVTTLCGRIGKVPVFREGYTLADVDCRSCRQIMYDLNNPGIEPPDKPSVQQLYARTGRGI